MFLKKENNRYFLSGGLEWYPLPEKLKTRKDVDEFLQTGNNSKPELSYATSDHKSAKLFEVYWWNGMFAQAKEDEDKILVIDLPAFASDEQISDYLRQRAKTKFNKEAVIHFIEARPEQPELD